MELALSLADITEVEFISFKKLYPAFIYPGGALKKDHTFPIRNHPRLNTKRRLTWYDPLGWFREGFFNPAALLHAQWWSLPLFPVYLAICNGFRIRRKPVVITVHNTLPHEKSFFYQIFSKILFRSGDHFIVHTEMNRDQMISNYGIPPEKVSLIPHGTLDFHIKPNVNRAVIRRQMGFDPSNRIILLFGAVRSYKGYETALNAFAEVITRIPECRLIIAGKLWVNWAPYQDLINRLNLSRHISTYLEYIPAGEVYRFFTAADLVVLPYHHFGSQSGVGATAISFRKPLIVTRVGGLPDLVVDPRFVVPPKDASSLAKAAIACLSNPDQQKSMAAGAAQVARKLSWSSIAAETCSVYRKVLDAPENFHKE